MTKFRNPKVNASPHNKPSLYTSIVKALLPVPDLILIAAIFQPEADT
jgi:hypothetical protein